MTADGPNDDWTEEVIAFLSENLPRYPGEQEWDHEFSSAFQMGCMAIVALGQAEETQSGAIPLKNPALPAVLPRWDDICVAVLSLANQCNKISYRLVNGNVPPEQDSASGVRAVLANSDVKSLENGTVDFRVVPLGKQPPYPAPNIAANGSLGPAHAAPDVLTVLKALGLVAGTHWSDRAELVFWREQPRAWKLDVLSDPRFAEAIQKAVETVPENIRNEIGRLVAITDEDIEACVESHRVAVAESRAKYGPNARILGLKSSEQAWKTLEHVGRNKLDWLFYETWRLPDGWLTESQLKRRLKIFHDPLAIQMRRAVVAHLHPDCPAFAE